MQGAFGRPRKSSGAPQDRARDAPRPRGLPQRTKAFGFLTALIDRYGGLAIDLDGVVWRSGKVLPDVDKAIEIFREADKRLLFLTNNAANIPARVMTLLADAGIVLKHSREVLSSAQVAVRWLGENESLDGSAFVLAADSVADQFKGLFEIVPVTKGNRADVVLVGRDLAFDFERLTVASDSIRDGATFVAFNKDATMPVTDGLEPGTGAIVAALEAASGRAAVVVGKPELPMMERAKQMMGEIEVLMVGDRVDSDILGAKRIGWDSALMLSGVTGRGEKFDPEPTYVFESLIDLAKATS